MHLAEGMLPFYQMIGWSALATPILIWSIRGEQIIRRDNPMATTLIASVTSILFAATLLPLPVPVVGATSHICLTPLFGLILGIRRIVWPAFFVLLLQAVFFAHGGLTTLGINMLSLGLFGPLITLGCWTVLKKVGLENTTAFGAACAIGGLGVYVIDAVVLSVALMDLAKPTTTFFSVLVGFAPVQVPLAILEAFVSVKIVQLLANRRPDLLPEHLSSMRTSSIPTAMILLIVMSSFVSGCTYEGIDGTIFGATAESAGRPPNDSIIDLSQGEFGLAMTIVILFGAGFVAGRTWEKLFSGGRDAFPH